MRVPVLVTILMISVGLVAPMAADRMTSMEPRGDLTLEDLERVVGVTSPTLDFSKAEPFEAMSGGASTSTKQVNRDSFSHFSANLSFAQEEQFKLGNALFRKLWVASPSSTLASDGLGPLFNARACQSCHVKDGRGRPPLGNEAAVSMFLRLSVPPQNDAQVDMLEARNAANIPEPNYGAQLQNFSVPGHPSEGRMVIEYTSRDITLGDGSIVTLRVPHYSVVDLGYGDMAPDVMMSPRVTQQMIGLGLLEQIHPADILANVDEDDENGDSISGRASWVKLPNGELILGRFGWKAGMPTVRAQSAAAFAGDIGISTPDHPSPYGDCTMLQISCLNGAHGAQANLGVGEAPETVIQLVTFYSQNLAVPARRDVDRIEVLAGKELFYATGCIACHTPKFVTRRDTQDVAQMFQLIWPYTDMLLHDLGDGLADNRPDGDATGREWRTPPLWGIGLTETVSDHTNFLHDGRAQNLEEAILWHGGEAQESRDAYSILSADERAAMISFLESL